MTSQHALIQRLSWKMDIYVETHHQFRIHDHPLLMMMRCQRIGGSCQYCGAKSWACDLFCCWLWQIVCCHFSDKLVHHWSFQLATSVIQPCSLLQNFSQYLSCVCTAEGNHHKILTWKRQNLKISVNCLRVTQIHFTIWTHLFGYFDKYNWQLG